jgi:hypothetical protein
MDILVFVKLSELFVRGIGQGQAAAAAPWLSFTRSHLVSLAAVSAANEVRRLEVLVVVYVCHMFINHRSER